MWAWLEAFAAGPGGVLAVQSYHDPNGGPWELSARRLDGEQSGAPFTSEPAGPLAPVLAAVAGGFLAAWASPTFGVEFVTIAADGTAGSPTALPSAAPPGEAEVALAAAGGRVAAVYVDRDGVRLRGSRS